MSLNPVNPSVRERVYNSGGRYPDIDATRKHLYCLNVGAQTVSCIDTGTDTVVATITLPASSTYRSMHYRHIDDCVYVWGTATVCKIDVNPSSGTFNSVFDMNGTSNATSPLSNIGFYNIGDVAYDPVNDLVVLSNGSTANFYLWNFRDRFAAGSTTVALTQYASTSYPSVQGGSIKYIGYGRFIFPFWGGTILYNVKKGLLRKLPWLWSGGGSFQMSCIWNRRYDYLYLGVGSIRYFDLKTYLQVGTLTIGSGTSAYSQFYSCLTYCPDYDLLFSAIKQGTDVAISDMSNNTQTGTFTRTNLDTNETFSNSAAYSMYSKKVYLKGGGNGTVTRVHKFNPQTWITNGRTNLADMIDGYITVGNMSSASTVDGVLESKLCMNHLIPY